MSFLLVRATDLEKKKRGKRREWVVLLIEASKLRWKKEED